MSISGILITRITPLICGDQAKAHLIGKKEMYAVDGRLLYDTRCSGYPSLEA